MSALVNFWGRAKAGGPQAGVSQVLVEVQKLSNSAVAFAHT